MNKIFISTTSFAEYDKSPISILEEKGLKVALNPYGRTLTKEEIAHFLDGVVGLIAGTEVLNKEALSSARSLKVISRCGAGMDSIDLKAAEALGIKVFNTPDAPTLAVAELTIGLIFALLRHLVKADSSIREGKWKKYMGSLLQSKKVGIIGLGRIGKKVAEMLAPFGVEILSCEPKPDKDFINAHGIKNMTLQDILTNSDIVTLHLTRDTGSKGYFIGKREIHLMKKDAFLINTARGNLIDEEALICALKNNKICGAAIDVYEKEPYTGLLRELKNVILTSHMGSYAKEARIKMEREAVDNLIKGLGDKK
jgi:D-3-phosphoglycerate dehydrogenase / 2-oxoglutarate reductase